MATHNHNANDQQVNDQQTQSTAEADGKLSRVFPAYIFQRQVTFVLLVAAFVENFGMWCWQSEKGETQLGGQCSTQTVNSAHMLEFIFIKGCCCKHFLI